MLFKLTSFHATTDGGVKPQRPLFIRASTWFNARRVIAAALEVPSDDVILTLCKDSVVPEGADLMDERFPDQRTLQVA